LDGPGGTGKTYLYNIILAQLRSEGKVCLAVASSGIAAELLIGGRTAHSRFKIPLGVSAESMCNISVNSDLAKLLQKTDLIIWDEVPMCHKNVVETVDRTLRDIMQKDEPFGGITILFGGDFRPVVVRVTRAQVVNASIKRSSIWRHVQKMSLNQNMRVEDGDEEYNNFLLQVGEGRTEEIIKLPEMFQLDDNSLDSLIDFIYPDANSVLDGSIILTTRNKVVDDINSKVQLRINGNNSRQYCSADSIADTEQGLGVFPTEFLNSLVIQTSLIIDLEWRAATCP
jgi:hypothetical protein